MLKAIAPFQVGTQTNDNAPAGYIGEFITSTVATASAVSLTTNTAADLTTISLTAGDWDVSWVADFKPAATTSVTALKSSISLTLNTMGTQPGGSGIGTEALVVWNQAAAVPASDLSQDGGPVRVSLSATTTIHMVCLATFTVSTMAVYGTLRARRVR